MSVRWWPLRTGSRAEADDAVSAHVGAEFGQGEVVVGRLCPECGSSDHGRPWARRVVPGGVGGPGRHVRVPVSLSRSAPHLVTAIGAGESGGELPGIGVDVEEVARVESRLEPEDVLAPEEFELLDRPGLDLARVWVSKEAIAKALGTGLNRPLPEFLLADHHVVEVPAPAGFRAALSAG